MPATYEPIATTTLGSSQAAITFSSISSSYTDLVAVLNYNTTATSLAALYLLLNGDTGLNYSWTTIRGNGSGVMSNMASGDNRIQLSNNESPSNSQPKFAIVNIFSYAGNTNKTVLAQFSSDLNGSGIVVNSVGLWRNTAAITSVTLQTGTTFAAGTTATLYGILKA